MTPRKHLPLVLVSLTLVALCLSAWSVQAASVRGTLRGTVSDSQGNPIPDVTITIVDEVNEGTRFEVQTNAHGEYIYAGLKPVRYDVSAEKEGYQGFKQPGVKVRAGKQVEQDFELKSIEEAREEYIQEEMAPEERAILYFNQGSDAHNEGNQEQAEKFFRLAVEDNPELANAQLMLGVYAWNEEDFDEAKKRFHLATEVDEPLADGYRFLGIVAQREGDNDAALKFWKNYIDSALEAEQKPDSAIAFNVAALTMGQSGCDDAVKYLEIALKADPENGSAIQMMGNCLLQQQKFADALPYFEKYIEVQPDAPDVEDIKKMIKEIKDTLQ